MAAFWPSALGFLSLRSDADLDSHKYAPQAGMRGTTMHFGATMWFTEYAISPSELAVALEERGFESLWAEHSHRPLAGDGAGGEAAARRRAMSCAISATAH
jgi:hypothetical protein